MAQTSENELYTVRFNWLNHIQSADQNIEICLGLFQTLDYKLFVLRSRHGNIFRLICRRLCVSKTLRLNSLVT